jgi:S-adenosylmethionine:tRNA ribosyltransferase-isomerase
VTDDDFKLASYDYELPPELIAQAPLPERDASRLMTLDRATGALEHGHFRELPSRLRAGDLLVTNRSRVFPARLIGRRSRGGKAEILLVRRRGGGLWDAMLRPGRRLRPGMLVDVAPGLLVQIESPPGAETVLRQVRLIAEGGSEDEALERFGHAPLPPYIRREDGPADRERYQTVYAREPGSVAAPTAGLHFTPDLLGRLEARGVERAELVLHVGPGTFRPVEVEDVRQHRVEPERATIPDATAAAVERALREGRRVVAVGTTVTRALESALDAEGRLRLGERETDLVIVPGHPFRVVSALVTNFHLPGSSLLLLASAFAGREHLLAAYREAVAERYRFYSYGDAMLIA